MLGSRDWIGVRILGYHRVAEAPGDDLAVAPSAFREQMEAVLEGSAKPVRLEAALDLLEHPIEARYMCVTFDDAYHDNLENAAPILEELRIPATIFAPSLIIDGLAEYYWYENAPRALDWQEISDIVGGGLIDVQAHSRTHPRLTSLDDSQAREEIFGCKSEIESHLPYELTSFCYPSGFYGSREADLVREAGFRAGVTTDPGVNDANVPREMLRRTMIYGCDSLKDFRAKIDGSLDKPPLLRKLLYRRLPT